MLTGVEQMRNFKKTLFKKTLADVKDSDVAGPVDQPVLASKTAFEQALELLLSKP